MSAFVWDDSNFEFAVARKPLTILVAPTPLINKDFYTAITTGAATVKDFIAAHGLQALLMPECTRLDNFPEDPGAADGPVFIEPGMVLNEDAPTDELVKLLNDPTTNPPHPTDPGQRTLKLIVTPGKEWAVYRLRGSYGQLPQAVGQLMEKVVTSGRTAYWHAGGFHQHYLNFPPVTAEKDLITDICIHLLPVTQ